jgi:hypothetical protein
MKTDNLFRIELNITAMQDHAGVNFHLALFGYEIHLNFNDTRHWDYENRRWYTYHSDGTRT